jgi:hypothetical protein
MFVLRDYDYTTALEEIMQIAAVRTGYANRPSLNFYVFVIHPN